jgi:hypothetical protein
MLKAASYDKTIQPRPWRDWKTCQPGFARWKCTPSAYGTSPGGGGLFSASLSANLSRSLFNGGKSSPFGGKVVRQHQKGCISSRRRRGCMVFPPARAVCLFSPGEARLPGFLHTGGEAAHLNPRAKGASNLSPLRTLGPKGRHPSRPKGVSIKPPTFIYHLPFTISPPAAPTPTEGTHRKRSPPGALRWRR